MKGYKTKTDAYDVGTQFYKETHIRSCKDILLSFCGDMQCKHFSIPIRDEDDEMKKFIETEMGKIKGKDLETEKESEGTKYLSPEDAALQVFHVTGALTSLHKRLPGITRAPEEVNIQERPADAVSPNAGRHPRGTSTTLLILMQALSNYFRSTGRPGY